MDELFGKLCYASGAMLMRTINTLLMILISVSSAAHANTTSSCFEKEIDQRTHRVYQNYPQWSADLAELRESTPRNPGWIQLYRGYQVGKAASVEANQGSDKWKHCFVGCRIATVVSYDVAIYAAHYKEAQDLQDCRLDSRFDWEDVEATARGAEIALELGQRADRSSCRTQCAKEY